MLDDRVPLDDGPAPAPRRRPAVPRPATVPAVVPAPALPRWVVALLIGLAVAAAVPSVLLIHQSWQKPAPAPPPRTGLVAVGRAYVPTLATTYADSWEDGAKLLDAGQPVGTALDTVATSWGPRLTAAYNASVTPAFEKVLPQSKDEKDVTPEEKRALAAAWREFARGLRGGK
jgi:hypothetical protein